VFALWKAGGCMVVYGAPKLKVSCVMTNHQETLVHRNADGGGYLEEIDDWYVDCSLIQDSKKLWEGPLHLAHPTGYEEAMRAIDEFRKKAPEFLKDKSKTKKEGVN
jgi:hypothetical protein